MSLLHIDSSILGVGSVSRALSAEVAAGWRRRVPDLEVIYRDLAAEPLVHLADPGELGREASDRVVQEFLAADIVVIGAPMYNFTVPSQLKAWIDRLAVAGKTFRYTAEGPVGLAGGKKVIVVSSRGGVYSAGSPLEALDFQEPYLRAVFAFFGIIDVDFIRAEGIAIGPEHKERAIAAARQTIAAREGIAAAA